MKFFKRKGLRYREDILDNIGSTELDTNLFRITQTEEKLVNAKIDIVKDANKVHKTIKELGGTMTEDLSNPSKSLKQPKQEIS